MKPKLDEQYKYMTLAGRPEEQIELLKEIVGEARCLTVNDGFEEMEVVSSTWRASRAYWPTLAQLETYYATPEQDCYGLLPYKEVILNVVIEDGRKIGIKNTEGAIYPPNFIVEGDHHYTAIEYEFETEGGIIMWGIAPITWFVGADRGLSCYKELAGSNPQLVVAKRARCVRFV